MRKEIVAKEKGYTIDEKGVVFNKNGKVVKGYLNKDGYRVFSIRDYEGKTKTVSFHRLQAFTKYGNKLFKEGIETRHLNSIKLDNTYQNIAIGTHSQNMFDQPKEQRLRKALIATSYVRKYDKEKVRSFYNNCKSYKKTMLEFNISSKGTLHHILNK